MLFTIDFRKDFASWSLGDAPPHLCPLPHQFANTNLNFGFQCRKIWRKPEPSLHITDSTVHRSRIYAEGAVAISIARNPPPQPFSGQRVSHLDACFYLCLPTYHQRIGIRHRRETLLTRKSAIWENGQGGFGWMIDRVLRYGIVGIVLLATGCISTGEIDNPVMRRATWFSFVSGGDIAQACQNDGMDRYRMVYVADRREQVRIYDLTLAPDRQPELRSRVMAVNVSDWLRVQNRSGFSGGLSPTDQLQSIPMEAALPILEAMNKAGWSMRPPPVGQKIASHSYYWLASGCENGAFHFQAWDYPDPEFLALEFPELLFALDTTTLRPRAAPSDGQRRIFDRVRPRVGYTNKDDRLELYNIVVTDRGVEPSL